MTGSAAVNADTSSGNQQTALLLTALIIVAVILLLVYRSPVLWLLPLVGAVGAIIVAQASAHGLANAGLTVSSLSADILIVLVFGAASDYALLLVHRYREELRHHATTEGAMATALRATLPTLAASAATVTCAMLCLLTADSASLHGLGPVGAVGIVAAFLAQATFLPALLLVIGRAAFWPRIPRAGADQAARSPGSGPASARGSPAIPPLPRSCSSWHSARRAPACASLHIDNNPVDNVKGNAGSVDRGAAAHRALPHGREQPARAARTAGRGGCRRGRRTRYAGRQLGGARCPGRGLRQLLRDPVGGPVRPGGDNGHRGPAPAALAGSSECACRR